MQNFSVKISRKSVSSTVEMPLLAEPVAEFCMDLCGMMALVKRLCPTAVLEIDVSETPPYQGNPLYRHVIGRVAAESVKDAQTGAEIILNELAEGQRAFIRVRPKVDEQEDFEGKHEVRGYVRFTYVPGEAGRWADAEQVMGSYGFGKLPEVLVCPKCGCSPNICGCLTAHQLDPATDGCKVCGATREHFEDSLVPRDVCGGPGGAERAAAEASRRYHARMVAQREAIYRACTEPQAIPYHNYPVDFLGDPCPSCGVAGLMHYADLEDGKRVACSGCRYILKYAEVAAMREIPGIKSSSGRLVPLPSFEQSSAEHERIASAHLEGLKESGREIMKRKLAEVLNREYIGGPINLEK